MIFNLGSINADYIYSVPHLPVPGETLVATAHSRELGGKGANQSVAAARAGAQVSHIGTVGPDAGWILQALNGYGVGTDDIAQVDTPTGHAVINVDAAGENAIVILPGANQDQSLTRLKEALNRADRGDILLLQNETNLQVQAARLAKSLGMKVIYSAAPFSAFAVQEVLPFIDILVMNAVESQQLVSTLDTPLAELPVPVLIITRGSAGSDWIEHGKTHHTPSRPVDVIDTTGAGDCFIGYVAAGLDEGLSPQSAMMLASVAASLQVQRPGTAGAMPNRAEVDACL